MDSQLSLIPVDTIEARLATRPRFGRTYEWIASLETGYVSVSFDARRQSQLVTVRWEIIPDEGAREVWRSSVPELDFVAVDHLLVDTVNSLTFEAIEVDYGAEYRVAAERLGKAPWQVGGIAGWLSDKGS